MASNFAINQTHRDGSLYMELRGDFDGSSAMELLNRLDSCLPGVKRIVVNTDGLKDIHSFGRLVFQNNFSYRKGENLNISFTGTNNKILSDKII